MLATRHRLPRNPLFQFHPLHALFSVLGALFLTPLPELLRGLVGAQHIVYGAILLAVLLFLPNGLVSIGRSLFKPSRAEAPK